MLYESNTNPILEMIKRIDVIQKDIINDSTDCIGCDNVFFLSDYNTIPIAFTTNCCQQLTGIIDSTTTTNYFRIESIINEHYVKLRLLNSLETGLVGTNRTLILDTNALIAIQCFEPINVEPCSNA